MKDKKENKEPQEEVINEEQNTGLENLEARIVELEGLLAEEKNAKLLALAEFQNYRKRLENDKNDYKVFAMKLIMGQLMQVIDDFDRTSKDLDDKLKESKIKGDVKSIFKMLADKVEMIIIQNGFDEIEIKVGDKFDHNTMEALTTTPLLEEDKKKDGTVVHIDQKAFRHIESGLVFKTAKVIIGKFNK
jgi:molecular chaperone GrpE